MRSISEILNLVVDGVVTTKAQAEQIIEEEITARIAVARVTEEEARSVLLENIGYATGYMTDKTGDKVMRLFNTQHPIWGRTHPTAEEALRLGIEYGTQGDKRNGETD
jgi:hypothetical protein